MSARIDSRKSLVGSQVVRLAVDPRDNETYATTEGGELLECIGATLVLLIVCAFLAAALV